MREFLRCTITKCSTKKHLSLLTTTHTWKQFQRERAELQNQLHMLHQEMAAQQVADCQRVSFLTRQEQEKQEEARRLGAMFESQQVSAICVVFEVWPLWSVVCSSCSLAFFV